MISLVCLGWMNKNNKIFANSNRQFEHNVDVTNSWLLSSDMTPAGQRSAVATPRPICPSRARVRRRHVSVLALLAAVAALRQHLPQIVDIGFGLVRRQIGFGDLLGLGETAL